jgi:hypothetical protein
MNLFSDAGQHTFAVTSPALQIRCLSQIFPVTLPAACRDSETQVIFHKRTRLKRTTSNVTLSIIL